MGVLRRTRIGVLGGSFNPIHLGHLFAAEEVMHALSLDQVIFVVSPRPPFKEAVELLDAETRYLMVAMAVGAHPRFRVSRVEMDRPGVSYTVDTIEELRKKLPSRGDLYFIVGMDAAMELSSWKEPDRLLELCRLAVVSRPGFEKEKAVDGLDPEVQRLVSHPAVLFVETPGLEISSTEIRRRVREGKPYRYLLPEVVACYIENHGIYR